jgi:hypothetical protein
MAGAFAVNELIGGLFPGSAEFGVGIRNRVLQTVVLNGRMLDRKTLDEIQSRLEASAPNQ